MEEKKKKDHFPDSPVTSASDGAILMDPDGLILSVNSVVAERLRRPVAELIGINVHNLLPPSLAKTRKKQLKKAVSSHKPLCFEDEQEGVWLDHCLYPLLDERGDVSRVAIVAHNITDRKKAEEALYVTQTHYRTLFETARDGILILDGQTGRIEDVNPFLVDLTGYSYEELVGKSLWEIGVFKETEVARAALEELLSKGYARYGNLPIESKRGKLIDVEFVSNIYSVKGRKVIQCNIRDVTQRKRAETRIRETQERLRTLSRSLLKELEAERRHIARELHDEIGQALTAIKIHLQSLARLCTRADFASGIAQGVAMADVALGQVRSLTLNLRPPMLDDLGLAPALRWLADQTRRSGGLKVRFIAEDIPRLPAEIETTCFRVAQEAMTNVVRHAKALKIVMTLRLKDTALVLSVQDDGIGFDVARAQSEAARGGSVGLLSMQERIVLANGSLDVASTPGKGTQVTARFPLKGEKD